VMPRNAVYPGFDSSDDSEANEQPGPLRMRVSAARSPARDGWDSVVGKVFLNGTTSSVSSHRSVSPTTRADDKDPAAPESTAEALALLAALKDEQSELRSRMQKEFEPKQSKRAKKKRAPAPLFRLARAKMVINTKSRLYAQRHPEDVFGPGAIRRETRVRLAPGQETAPSTRLHTSSPKRVVPRRSLARGHVLSPAAGTRGVYRRLEADLGGWGEGDTAEEALGEHDSPADRSSGFSVAEAHPPISVSISRGSTGTARAAERARAASGSDKIEIQVRPAVTSVWTIAPRLASPSQRPEPRRLCPQIDQLKRMIQRQAELQERVKARTLPHHRHPYCLPYLGG
jgi:hypothetical protein